MPAGRVTVLVAVIVAAPVFSGCVRTDDGTLLFSDRTVPMRMTSRLDPANYSTRIRERREREREVSNFPAAPETPDTRWRPRTSKTPRVPMVRVTDTAPFKPAASNNGLTCRDEVTAGGRVKVVCE